MAFARQVEGDPPVHPFEGVEVPLSTLLAIELGELLVHGFDIARAAHLPWPIDPAAAVLTLQGYLPLMPYTLDVARARGVQLAVEIRIRRMRPVVVVIADDALVVDESSGQRVDAHIAATPTAYLLLMWNRIPPGNHACPDSSSSGASDPGEHWNSAHWRTRSPVIRGLRSWRALELGPLAHA